MRHFAKFTVAVVAVGYFAFVSGCNKPTTNEPATAVVEPQSHDDHDEDGHDEDGHGHDHDDDGHGHDHDHGDAKMIDASKAGLDADALVHLDEAEMPENYADSVKLLVEMRDEIRDGFAAGNVEQADGPLHEVGHLLEHIETLVNNSSLSSDQKKQAAEAIESLFDLFGEVDARVHDEQSKAGKEYSDVAESVDASVKVLVDFVDAAKK
ncbi:hypothetical protein SH528x_005729 [Novipirellula sp. SH528]|uniref:hypothetical protein n=1 Tax=Novipirellula sp. SH528 TaxID=3454466 RepID=UPI003FA186B0